MELRQLRTFLTVGKLLSFNRAADNLHYAQSTVSAQIKALEEEFGLPLFDRLGKQVALTGAGELLMQYAAKLMAMEDETVAQISGWEEPRGSITLRVPQSIGICFMPAVLRTFQVRFPHVSFKINSCAFDSLKQEFRSGVTDLAFLIADQISAGDLVMERLGFVSIAAVCSPHHHLNAKSSIGLEDFAGQTVLIPQHDCSYRMGFENELLERNITLGSIIEVNSVEVIKRCAAAGVGIALLPDILVRNDIASGSLCRLAWPAEPQETAIFMLHHRDKWLSPQLLAFMQVAREEIRIALESDSH